MILQEMTEMSHLPSFCLLRIERGPGECPRSWVKVNPDHSRKTSVAVAMDDLDS